LRLGSFFQLTMLVAVLLVSAHAVSMRGLRLKLSQLEDPAPKANASKAVEWGSFVGEYCEEFCQMKGVDAGRCTVCAQRMNFSVAEGKTSCAVECQGVQTDEVTESVVDCAERLDKCMFTSIEPAQCRPECGVKGAKKGCAAECVDFKVAERAAGKKIATFFGPNYVDVTAMENVTKVVNGTNTTVEKEVTTQEVKGVESLPTVGPGGIVKAEPADFRFHVNESAWKAHAHKYCDALYCATPKIDSYHCVECLNRLNNSVEHAMMSCRVGCDMHHTDQARANELVEDDARCDNLCMTTEFEKATCTLEAETQVPYGVPPPQKLLDACTKNKADQRAAGKKAGPESDVTPYFWPSDANATHPPAKEDISFKGAQR